MNSEMAYLFAVLKTKGVPVSVQRSQVQIILLISKFHNDVRGFFYGGKKEKGKKDSSESGRAEDSFRIAANQQEAAIPRGLRVFNKEALSKPQKLFDIECFVAKLEMPFTTCPQLCQLEQKHVIDLGKARTDKACNNLIMAISR